MTAKHLGGADYQLHAMDFLHYAYLQTGREAKAIHLSEELKAVPGATAEQLASSQATFASRDAVELHHWKEAAALAASMEGEKAKDWPAGAKIDFYWASAMGAARSGDAQGARQDLEKLKQAHENLRAKKKNYGTSGNEDADLQEAEAWVAFAEGKTAQAVRILRAAADQEDKHGVDSLSMPTREMLGDMMLELRQPGAALAAFKASLAEAPHRFDGLYGAARAAELSGAQEKTKTYYAKLIEISGQGGSERPELHEAGAYLAQNENPATPDEKSSRTKPR